MTNVQKGIKQYLESDIFQDYKSVHKKHMQISLNEHLGAADVSSDKIIPFHAGQIEYIYIYLKQLLDRALESSLNV